MGKSDNLKNRTAFADTTAIKLNWSAWCGDWPGCNFFNENICPLPPPRILTVSVE